MADPTIIKISDILEMGRAGKFDVVSFGRAFEKGPEWVAELLDSIARGLPVSGMVWSKPQDNAWPDIGRYHATTEAMTYILDGQQRSTATCAAAGIRPGCFPEWIWEALGGPALQAGVVLESTRRLPIRPLRKRRHPQVALRDLLADDADIPELVIEAGVKEGSREAAEYAAKLGDMRRQILNAGLPVSWHYGDLASAAETYRRLNKDNGLADWEFQTVALELVVPGARRDVLDPLRWKAASRGFSAVVTGKLLNELIQRQLPARTRRLKVDKADPAEVVAAVTRARHAVEGVMDRAERYGLVDASLIYMPAGLQLLMHLAARFPEALQDGFARRWLVHALVTDRYRTIQGLAEQDLRVVLSAASYQDACQALAVRMAADPWPGVADERLQSRVRGRFGTVATLYALACGCPAGLGVQDLLEPEAVFPSTPMTLVPLWRGELEHSLGNYVLATAATAEVLREHGGWTPAAYEQLRCGNDALDAQCLPVPARGTAAAVPEIVVKERERDLLRRLEVFIQQMTPLLPHAHGQEEQA
ncbi:hypothetical protein GCM10023088_51550 [Actinomadura verrucosospora]|uniref:DUF262 domain-containing protein n=1 Tax=Actinomadura verrucosospora TaxID=46165 RepID=UPI0031EE9F8C